MQLEFPAKGTDPSRKNLISVVPEHPPNVYVIVTSPGSKSVTMPVIESIVAMVVELLCQVPPLTESVNVQVEPKGDVVGPVIGGR